MCPVLLEFCLRHHSLRGLPLIFGNGHNGIYMLYGIQINPVNSVNTHGKTSFSSSYIFIIAGKKIKPNKKNKFFLISAKNYEKSTGMILPVLLDAKIKMIFSLDIVVEGQTA